MNVSEYVAAGVLRDLRVALDPTDPRGKIWKQPVITRLTDD